MLLSKAPWRLLVDVCLRDECLDSLMAMIEEFSLVSAAKALSMHRTTETEARLCISCADRSGPRISSCVCDVLKEPRGVSCSSVKFQLEITLLLIAP